MLSKLSPDIKSLITIIFFLDLLIKFLIFILGLSYITGLAINRKINPTRWHIYFICTYVAWLKWNYYHDHVTIYSHFIITFSYGVYLAWLFIKPTKPALYFIVPYEYSDYHFMMSDRIVFCIFTLLFTLFWVACLLKIFRMSIYQLLDLLTNFFKKHSNLSLVFIYFIFLISYVDFCWRLCDTLLEESSTFKYIYSRAVFFLVYLYFLDWFYIDMYPNSSKFVYYVLLYTFGWDINDITIFYFPKTWSYCYIMSSGNLVGDVSSYIDIKNANSDVSNYPAGINVDDYNTVTSINNNLIYRPFSNCWDLSFVIKAILLWCVICMSIMTSNRKVLITFIIFTFFLCIYIISSIL